LKSTLMIDRSAGSTINRAQLALGGLARDDDHVNSLTLSTELADSIVEYLRGCLPDEGVGVVATSGFGSSMTAVRFYPGRNMDRSPRRYTMDAADVVAALVNMKREKTRLGVIVHSHPTTPPVPSRTDLVEASCPGVLSLIVGFSPVVELKTWRPVFGSRGVAVRFEEVTLIYSGTAERSPLRFMKRTGHKRGMPRDPVKGST
jgi:[CysO sulfur-carrier protein]-S-L-cysteine hydrolase